MATVVVLGSHGGGTSLIAGVLDALGVRMNHNPNARVTVPRWTYLNYEDSAFVRLNTVIIRDAGGEWYRIPSRNRFQLLKPRHEKRLKELLSSRRRKGRLWGWKDPRSCLTIHLIHPFLENPHYVYITRNYKDAARSLNSRGPSEKDLAYWVKLSREYYKRAYSFYDNVDAPKMITTYSNLASRHTTREIKRIAKFLGLSNKNVSRAVKRVKR